MKTPVVLMVDDIQVKTAMDAAEAECRERQIRVERYPDMDALAADSAALQVADMLIVSSNFPCTRAIMQAAPQLRAVIFPASGTETIDLAAAEDLSIVVGHGADPENAESMAEATIMFVLVLLYDLHKSERLLRSGQPRPEKLYARMLKGRTIGLIGFGRIGRAIAVRLQNWGASIVAFSPNIGEKDLPPGVRTAELDDLIRQSDVVCIVCALTEQTRGMIDAQKLGLLKSSAVLVNVSRGAVVDEQALYEATKNEKIARIACDTFVVEPLPANSPLRQLNNAILTPHIVGHTRDAIDAGSRTLIESVLRVLAGRPPTHVRNPEVMPAWQAKWEGAPRLVASD